MSMPPTIRLADEADLEALLSLVVAFYEVDGHPYDAATVLAGVGSLLTEDGPGFVVVAEAGDGLVGYAVMTWGWSVESGGRDALLDEIYTASPGLGIGSALMMKAMEVARAGGASRVFLETERGNEAARRFYARLGFEAEDSIWMVLTL